MIRWTTTQLSLMTSPTMGMKLLDIPAKSLVESHDLFETDNKGRLWDKVNFQTNTRLWTGYVRFSYTEPYIASDADNIIKVRNATLNPSDGAQYLVYKGRVQYNLCGEFAVCYCAGWDYDMEEWLDEVAAKKQPNWFQRLFRNGLAPGTTIYDLDVMLTTFDYKTPSQTFEGALYDRDLGRALVTPGKLKALLQDNQVICSCTIETYKGQLKSKGVLHWVVIEEVIPDRFGGTVRLYNPFSNSIERYSWDVFIESMKIPYGVVLPR